MSIAREAAAGIAINKLLNPLVGAAVWGLDRRHVTVVGIDVGGPNKGFHAVSLRDGQFEKYASACPGEIADWCNKQAAEIIAIDAPCRWAATGGSRLAERSLAIQGQAIHCFKTPTRSSAEGRGFYEWVRNGEKLYDKLHAGYQLFDGINRAGKVVIETFPHAVACALAGIRIGSRQKSTTRRSWLKRHGYDPAGLPTIDYVDAALCAVTAERFLLGKTIAFGSSAEGLIVIPAVAAQCPQ